MKRWLNDALATLIPWQRLVPLRTAPPRENFYSRINNASANTRKSPEENRTTLLIMRHACRGKRHQKVYFTQYSPVMILFSKKARKAEFTKQLSRIHNYFCRSDLITKSLITFQHITWWNRTHICINWTRHPKGFCYNCSNKLALKFKSAMRQKLDQSLVIRDHKSGESAQMLSHLPFSVVTWTKSFGIFNLSGNIYTWCAKSNPITND